MPRSKSKTRKNVIRKEGWVKPEEDYSDNIMSAALPKRRIEKHSVYGFSKYSNGRVLPGPKSKRLLDMGDMNVKEQKKTVKGVRIRSKSSKRGTVLKYGINPDYTPSPKKKTCCERWFGRRGSKKRNKKCKKKCNTRKRKRKSKTRKKKRRRRKKGTRKR